MPYKGMSTDVGGRLKTIGLRLVEKRSMAASVTLRSDYHSAYLDPLECVPLQQFRIGASVAFQHDIMDGLPEIYGECDALYAELPWTHGFGTFNKRAGVTTIVPTAIF